MKGGLGADGDRLKRALRWVEEDAKYTAYFARIHTIDPLTELVNQLLSAPTLAAFEEKVIAYLPREQEQK